MSNARTRLVGGLTLGLGIASFVLAFRVGYLLYVSPFLAAIGLWTLCFGYPVGDDGLAPRWWRLGLLALAALAIAAVAWVRSPSGRSALAMDSAPAVARLDKNPALGMPIGIGSRVGRYRLTGVLGHDDISVRFRAHRDDTAEVALRALTPRAAADPKVQLSFLREARELALSMDPNTPRIVDVGMSGTGLPFQVFTLGAALP